MLQFFLIGQDLFCPFSDWLRPCSKLNFSWFQSGSSDPAGLLRARHEALPLILRGGQANASNIAPPPHPGLEFPAEFKGREGGAAKLLKLESSVEIVPSTTWQVLVYPPCIYDG